MAWEYDSGGKSQYQDRKAYNENWERIFGKKKESEEVKEEAHEEQLDLPLEDK